MGLRERSGSVSSKDKLVAFLYVLMRDHLVPGAVEEIMRTVEPNDETHFSNGHLAKYAQDVVERLKNGSAKTEENK
jgi:hypothetical protein